MNETGNRDGVSREFAATKPKNPMVREETYRNGRLTGIGRTFFPNGKVERVVAYGESGREASVVEWNGTGQLTELRCADKPLLGTAFNTVMSGTVPRERVELFTVAAAQARSLYAQGKRISHEALWSNGKVSAGQSYGDQRVEAHFRTRHQGHSLVGRGARATS